MNKIYIVHCWDGNKDDGWYPWLDKKISNKSNKVIRFNMPNTANPKIEEWVSELDRQVEELDEHTFFVGHSIGCQTIMRYLESKKVKKIGGILFVAPWLDLLEEAISDEESYNTAQPWINTPIDFEKIKKFTNNITCIFSDNDYFISLEQEKRFKELLNAKTVIVKDKGHISIDDGVKKLNEIYNELIEIINFKVNDYDKFAEKRHYEVTNGMKKSLRFVEKPMMLSMLPNIEGKRVLLLGCGTAEESEMLSKYNPKKITGIDISEKSIAIAKESYPNCNFYVGDMLNLPFKENEFDFIFSSLAITHVEDKDKVFKELYRVLDDNGQVLFSVGHPMRFATEKINYNGNNFHIIGFESGSDGKQVLGKYMSHTKQVNYFKDNEVLEEFIAPPSYYFEILKHNNFVVEDFKESRCIDECKEIDEAYYNRFHEIPQFMGFLAKKTKN